MLSLAACGTGASPSVPGTLPLPTPATAPIAPDLCAGTRIEGVLHGDSRDPLVAWLVDATTGARRDVVWPAGYRARFGPGLEVLDAGGAVVLRAGQAVTRACGVSDDGRLYLAPPFD